MGLLVQRFRLSSPPPIIPRYNIAPTQMVATVSQTDGDRQLVFRKWGMIPSLPSVAATGRGLINARAETVATKPPFRSAFAKQRCLIPADGYYEWRAVGKTKQPYLFHFPDDEPFAFAGLWDCSRAADGSLVETCTIITTSANEVTKSIHDRMPLIVDQANYDAWLDSTLQDLTQLSPLLKSATGSRLIAEPVSTHVNNARNDTPECVEKKLEG